MSILARLSALNPLRTGGAALAAERRRITGELAAARERLDYLSKSPRPTEEILEIVERAIDRVGGDYEERLRASTLHDLLERPALEDLDPNQWADPLLARKGTAPSAEVLSRNLIALLGPEIKAAFRRRVEAMNIDSGPPSAQREGEIRALQETVARLEKDAADLREEAERQARQLLDG